MKNIIRMIVTLVVTALVLFLMVKGISIGNIRIYSIYDIMQENEKLDEAIANTAKLKEEDYKNEESNLDSETKKLQIAKQSYLDEASISTDSEIKKATVLQSYSMEYLWNKIGSYATEEGVNVKCDVSGSDNKYKLSFAVVGSYISIINYVYDLENDSNLAFTISKFKITGADSLSATFEVNDVSIKSETVSDAANSASSAATAKDTNNTTSNTTSATESSTNTAADTNTATTQNQTVTQ